MIQDTRHKRIQNEVVETCRRLGYAAKEEQRGEGWRADVLASKASRLVAFEVQLSNQSLQRTLERQAGYVRVGVQCCWLFGKPPNKLLGERPDLPVFTVSETPEAALTVSLSGRNEISLGLFVEQFLEGGIRYCPTARTRTQQNITLVFYEMICWNCGTVNHPYFIDAPLRASCNAVIEPDEDLWESARLTHRPEVVSAVQGILSSPDGRRLRVGEIKPRFSKTVGREYISFGCCECDSIFGDWFIMNAELDARNGYDRMASFAADIRIEPGISLPIPHWCYPEGDRFCDE